VIETLIGPTIL